MFFVISGEDILKPLKTVFYGVAKFDSDSEAHAVKLLEHCFFKWELVK